VTNASCSISVSRKVEVNPVFVVLLALLAAIFLLSWAPENAEGATQQTEDTAASAADTAAAAAGDSTTVSPDSARSVTDTTAIAARDSSVTATSDTTIVSPPPVMPEIRYSVFDSISHRTYIARHSYTLDNYLEHEPGFFVGRYGPIGKRAFVSRYSFGRGRCTLYLNGIPLNDPQNGAAPLPNVPVSGLERLLKDAAAGDFTPDCEGMEGRIGMVEATPSPVEPTTFLELSKSTQRNVRQRRVWFSSMRGKIGLDFGYDEILNDGYSFDARQLDSDSFLSGQDYGMSHSRFVTVNLRGVMPNRDTYVFSIRRFLKDSVGDLKAVDSEQGFGGFIASVVATMGPVDLKVFSRGYDMTSRPSPSSAPDSNTVNLTTAAYADWAILRSAERSLSLGGGFETTNSVQTFGTSRSENTLQKSTARLSTFSRIGGGLEFTGQLSGVSYRDYTTGWGGRASLLKTSDHNDVSVYLRRGYRMPNLGELFMPAHVTDAGGMANPFVVSGNRYLESEFGWELGGGLTSRLGPLTNELRVFALRMHRPIAFTPTTVDGETWRVAQNVDKEAMGVIDDRIEFTVNPAGFQFHLSGSVQVTGGDRESYFRTVPEWNAHASFRFGRSIFQKTSALYVGCDYTYCSSRSTLLGGELPAYNLLNVKLDGRLLNAQLYFFVINALDEQYQTIEGYLMTPRTWVYGIAWKIFD
jgi:hypothetical protein